MKRLSPIASRRQASRPSRRPGRLEDPGPLGASCRPNDTIPAIAEAQPAAHINTNSHSMPTIVNPTGKTRSGNGRRTATTPRIAGIVPRLAGIDVVGLTPR